MAKQHSISIDGHEINVQRLGEEDYISLTNMANWDNDPNARSRIQAWLKNGATVRFLELWEQHNNPDFNYIQTNVIKTKISENAYVLTAKRWIEETNAIGIRARAGRYGGTYAHRDIAFEFASWLSPEFKFYLIREFQRLKADEYSRQKLEWSYQRFLTKVNYRLHTDSIRDHLIPKLQASKAGEWLVYADEADLLNKAVFGMTREWREANTELAEKGNIRDYADIAQLNVLANLESLNAVMLENGTDKAKRFELLVRTAISQYQRLSAHDGLKGLEE
ncbi:MAG: KilA-N domain-containing protein [Bacteroidia bacterium]